MAEGGNYSPYVIIGKLSRDFILTSDGEDINDIPGGHLLYTAIGMTPWETHPALVARIGKNYPEQFLTQLESNRFSVRGIKRINEDIEQRNFISYFNQAQNQSVEDKKAHSVLTQYFAAGKPFPRELLGYNSRKKTGDSLIERTPETILVRDIPTEYLEARCVHLCPMDFLSHNLLPQAFSGTDKRTVTVEAGRGYMQPHFFDAVKSLVNGLTGFVVRESYLRNLFVDQYRISQLSDMMKILLDYGAENIVLKTNERKYMFINRADRIIQKLAPEPSELFEKIGELACFCGAYLVGLNETYDYRKAVAYGAARASLLKNDINPYNNLHVFDQLVMEKARIMENRIEE